MSVAPVAEQVDDHVLAEVEQELGGEAHHGHHGFGIVAVHVHDRQLDHLAHVGAVGPRARAGRVGGEADLVVDDQVERAARVVARELGEHQRLGHEALARERGVAVQEQAHHAAARLVVAQVLLRAHLAEHDRIDGLEVRGIRREREVELAVAHDPVGRRAHVVLDVARAVVVVGGGAAAELGEDRAIGLVHHVREHVQAPAVRHADRDLLHAELGRAPHDLLERRDRRFGAVEAEALGADPLAVDEALERLGRGEVVEDLDLALALEHHLVLDALDALLDPRALRGILDVHVLDADDAAVDAAQRADDLAQRRLLEAELAAEEDRAIEVFFAEAVGGRLELGVAPDRLQVERVEPRGEVAARAVGVDQRHRLDRIERGGARGRGARGGRARPPAGDAAPARRSRWASAPASSAPKKSRQEASTASGRLRQAR